MRQLILVPTYLRSINHGCHFIYNNLNKQTYLYSLTLIANKTVIIYAVEAIEIE